MKYYGIKKRKAEGYSAERRGDRRSILFSYGQVEFGPMSINWTVKKGN